MADDFNFQEARAELAKTLKDMVGAHAGKIAELRARELNKSTGQKLTKHDLCPLCGNADRPGSCTCLSKGEKYDCAKCGRQTFTINKTPNGKPICGSCNRKPPVPDDQRKEPVQKGDMMAGNVGGADAGPMAMSELCKTCGRKGDLCKCSMVKEELKSDPKGKKTVLGAGMSQKAKAADTDQSDREYIAQRQAKQAKQSVKKEEMASGKELPLVRPAPEKAVAGAKLPGDSKSKKADQSDEGSGGEITKKGEYDDNGRDCPACGGHAEDIGSLGHTQHFKCKNCGARFSVKDTSKPMGVGNRNDKKDVKKSELRKDMSGGGMKKPGTAVLPGMGPKPMAPVAPVVGVPGKQPVGQGGGDAFKVPGMAKPTPIGQVNQEMGKLKSIAQRPIPGMGTKIANPQAMSPGVGMPKPVAGSMIARKDELSTGYGEKVGITTDMRPKKDREKDFTSNRPPVKKDELSVAAHADADKKAGGVGWLNSIRTSKKPKEKKPNDVMAVRDKMNLQAAKTEVPAPTGGLNSVNHNRRLLG